MTTKSILRPTLLAKRQALSPEVRQAWDMAIGARLVDWLARHTIGTLGIYSPIRGEPDLTSALTVLSARGVRLALPVVAAREAPLEFHLWQPGDAMETDGYGVSIPAAREEVRPDALLIPCIGFNAARFRLGYGGGFYDRTLAASPRPLAIGIAYGYSLTPFVADIHDIALDVVITEADVIE